MARGGGVLHGMFPTLGRLRRGSIVEWCCGEEGVEERGYECGGKWSAGIVLRVGREDVVGMDIDFEMLMCAKVGSVIAARGRKTENLTYSHVPEWDHQ